MRDIWPFCGWLAVSRWDIGSPTIWAVIGDADVHASECCPGFWLSLGSAGSLVAVDAWVLFRALWVSSPEVEGSKASRWQHGTADSSL